MGWLSKRSPRKRSRSNAQRKKLPERVLAPVEDIVEQGLLVADVAARMTVKNAIIMNALREHADYDEEYILGLVRSAVYELASERERDARHIARVRREVKSDGRSSWSESVYGSGDSKTLRHRQEVYERVADELRVRAEDEAYIADTAEKARRLAWAEIGDSLKERASHPYYGGGHDDDYRDHRDERIQQLIEKDLTSLVKQRAKGTKKDRARAQESAAVPAPSEG